MKYYILFSGLAAIMLLSACDSSIERSSLTSPTAETFFTNETEIQGGVNACYNFLNECKGGYFDANYSLDGLADTEYLRGDNTIATINGGAMDYTTSTCSTIWGRMYQGIGRCNLIIQKIDENQNNLSESVKKQFLGEVYFLRAYYYLKLISYFGDVQYTDKPIETVSEGKSITRTAKAEVLKHIYSDFDLAADYLNGSTVTTLGRATRGAALAFKARAALYNGDYQTAKTAAKQVMDSGTYSLYPTYEDLFSEAVMRSSSNKELIFAADYDLAAGITSGYLRFVASRMMGGYCTIVPTEAMIDSYECIDGKDISESSLFNKATRFENRDPRLYYSVVLPGDKWFGVIFNTHKDSTKCYNYETNTWVTNKDCYAFTQYCSFSGYLIRKYVNSAYLSSIDQSENPYYLCRYAEVLLTYAEAKIELNEIDQSCLDAINLVRCGRTDVKMPVIPSGLSQTQMRKVIRKERKVELAFENLRFQDILRWKSAEKVMNRPKLGRAFLGSLSQWPDVTFDENGDPVYDYNNYVPHPSTDFRVILNCYFNPDRDYLWPIPQREILMNPDLGQNLNY